MALILKSVLISSLFALLKTPFSTMKTLSLRFLTLLFLAFAPAMLFAQSMAVNKVKAKYEADYIPEFKSSLASRSMVPALGNIDVSVDYASFGDDAAGLDLAVRELHQIKGALMQIAKDKTGSESIQSKIKRVVIRKSAASDKGVKMQGSDLVVSSDSFELNGMIGTSAIQKYLEKTL